jgi:FlaA1/EpsC-like NDP-sugar epimerase
MKLSYKLMLSKTNQVVLDIVVFLFSIFAAYIIRFEGFPKDFYLKQLLIVFPSLILVRYLSFHLFSVYSIGWRYISIRDAFLIVKTTFPVSLILLAARLFSPIKVQLLKIPLSVIALEFLFVLVGTCGLRITRRLSYELLEREKLNHNNGNSPKRAFLIGAGGAGNQVAKEIEIRPDLGYEVVGFIDDDPKKFKSVLQGKKVLGNTSQIPSFAKKLNVKEAIITMANASSKDIRRIVNICEEVKLKVKIIPGLFEMLDEHVKISKIREININDLLGRDIVAFENHLPEVIKHYRDKKIMVTGAGGSIGSELCRQLTVLQPKEIILLDKDENSIYEIDTELNGGLKSYKLRSIIANIKNEERLEHIFQECRPEIIFHAAAHKHVPLMEHNVSEAILNNVCGTRNLACLADKYGIEKFIFISTDKAINPTSVMGATKKVGEIIIQDIASKSTTKFSCVRFGNVLGSRGSVVPLFQKQIAKGGPVTITHPDVRRYFMSISEAVQLIIQAGTIGDKGEIFVLDMGEPIRISDLAKDLIKLSGYSEGDIEIKYVGMRPGEKLYEEILVDEEKAKATEYRKIYIAPPIEVARNGLAEKLKEIVDAAEKGKDSQVIQSLRNAGIAYKGEQTDA